MSDPENTQWECAACGAVADMTAPFNGYCKSCGADYYAQDDDQPGDVWETGTAITIRIPGGTDWELTEDQALALAARLTSAVYDRLTRPYSNTDTSTILSRGRHHVTREDN